MIRATVKVEPNIYRVELGDGSARYRVQMLRGGRRASAYTTDFAEARALREAWAREGTPDPTTPEPRAVTESGAAVATIEVGLRAYIADLEDRELSSERVRYFLPSIAQTMPELLDTPVGAITESTLRTYAKARKAKGIKPASIRRELGMLRAMLAKARPDWRFPKGLMPAENNTRSRVLNPEQERAVFPMFAKLKTAAGDAGFWATFMRLGAITLGRATELSTLRWDMVDLTTGRVELPATKEGPDVMHLNDEAIALLRAHGKRQGGGRVPTGGYVFPNPKTGAPYHRCSVSRIWRVNARKYGLVDFHHHDLRHHGATVAANNGATAQDLMALGRWRSVTMPTKRYAFATNARLRNLSNAISAGLPQSALRVRSGSLRALRGGRAAAV